MGRNHSHSGNLQSGPPAPSVLSCFGVCLLSFLASVWTRFLPSHDNATGSKFNLTIVAFFSINADCRRGRCLDVRRSAFSPHESEIPPSIRRQYEASPALRGTFEYPRRADARSQRLAPCSRKSPPYPSEMKAGARGFGEERGASSSAFLP